MTSAPKSPNGWDAVRPFLTAALVIVGVVIAMVWSTAIGVAIAVIAVGVLGGGSGGSGWRRFVDVDFGNGGSGHGGGHHHGGGGGHHGGGGHGGGGGHHG